MKEEVCKKLVEMKEEVYKFNIRLLIGSILLKYTVTALLFSWLILSFNHSWEFWMDLNTKTHQSDRTEMPS